MKLHSPIPQEAVSKSSPRRSVTVLDGIAIVLSVFLLITSFACAEVKGYNEDFDTDAGGWGGDGSTYKATGGKSGGYHQASRTPYNPYHQPVTGKAAKFLKGDLIKRFGDSFRVSVDVKQIKGTNKGFIVHFYSKDSSGKLTDWYCTILPPGKVPHSWKRISFEVNALDDTGWTRGSGGLSFHDTLQNVCEFQLFGGSGQSPQPTVTGIDNFEITPLASAKASVPETFDSWAIDRKYRVLVDVQKSDEPFPAHMPFRKSIHFGRLLKKAGVGEAFVPGSVVVTNYDESTGKETVVPHLMSESFHAGSLGDVSWDIAQSNQTRYAVYFDTRQREDFKSTYVPMVGHGDNIRYNLPGGTSPIHTHGMRPVTGDVDGDGLVDLISPSIYTSTWGQPQFTFWFWKNVGTNNKPVFADFLRLHDVDGNVIPNNYNNCDLYDWNNDGRLDLVTSRGVYLNTGKVSPAGMPGLKKGGSIPTQGHKVFFIGLRDHDGDGVKDAFYYKFKAHFAYEGNPPRNYLQTTLCILKNTAGANRPPQFSSSSLMPIKLGGQTENENHIVSDFYDFDGDGDLDCVGEWLPFDRIPSIPKLVYWPNTAGPGQTPVYDKTEVISNYDTHGVSPAIPADNEAFKGLLVVEGHRVRYFERVGEPQSGQMPYHQDRGILQQLDGRCGVDGYNGIDVEDWEGDGDWDFVTGNEHGFVLLIRNVGSNDRPVFEAPVELQADGKPIRILRWHYIQDGNCEYYLGQTKPRYADWDGDGDKDLIVANHTNRILLFRNIGTREKPIFGKGELIRTRSDEAPFCFRNQPAVLDWNGDGKMDLLLRDNGGRLCLYLGTGEEEGLIVKSGQPLLYADGGAIWDHNKEHAVGQWDACDWDGDGDFDIIGQIGQKWGDRGPGLYENVGGNEKPVFKRPKRLSSFGTAISLSEHEHSFAVVDWYKQGKHDLVCGGESGWFFFFRRPALEAKTLPAASMSHKLEIKACEE